MSDHLTYLFFTAFVAQGAYAAMQPGMILSWLGVLLSKLPTWAHKPTHTCSVCMVSVWGTLGMMAIWMLGGGLLIGFMIPVYWLAAAGINWACA